MDESFGAHIHSRLVTDSMWEPPAEHDSSQFIIVVSFKLQFDNHMHPKIVRQIYNTALATPLATAVIVSLSS
jgi:hypothetical protein